MSSSDVSIAERARSLTRYGELGPIKLATSAIEFVMLSICIPLFIRDRKQPMIKYRSWTLTIFIVICADIYAAVDGVVSTDNFISYETAKFLLVGLDIGRVLIIPNFIAMTVRHYYLLMLPVLQTQLLDRETMLDPQKYLAVRKQLETVKVRSSERAVWFYYLIISFPTFIVALCLIPITEMDSYVLGYPTPLSQFTMGCGAAELLVATIWFIFFTMRAPMDNFYIKKQYSIIFALMYITCMPLTISSFVKVDGFRAIAASIMGIVGFVIIVVYLIFPLSFALSRNRYRLDSKGSSQPSQSSFETSPHAKSVGGASQSLGQVSINLDGNGPKQKAAHGGSVKLTLAKILEDPILSQAFRKYLAREFSMESLVFIEAVKQFRAHVIATPASTLVGGEFESAVNAVMVEFILPSAVNEVNLPRRYIDKLKTEHDSLRNEFDHTKASKLFDEAGEHIEHMLVVNHLRKFQTSKMYKEAIGLEDDS